MRDTTLGPARRRQNLKLETGAFVTRILFEGTRAAGVEYSLDGKLWRANARSEVLLSTGTLISPKLLMLSGIGPADHLRDHGITVLANSPAVGHNMQEHPHAALTYQVTERTLNQEVSPLLALRHGLDFAFRRRGALTSPYAHAVLFGRLSDESPWADYEVHFSPYGLTAAPRSADDAGYDADVRAIVLDKDAIVACYPCVLHPRSRGSISLRSGNPYDPPVIDMAMMGDAADGHVLAAACRAVCDIFDAPSMKPYVVRQKVPGDQVRTDQEWASYTSNYCFGGQHPVGTCRMGQETAAVVDPQLRVHGVQGLRVIDASIMPTITSGNTNAPTIMIAEKGADFVCGSVAC